MSSQSLNTQSLEILHRALKDESKLRIKKHHIDNSAVCVDFGVEAIGGIDAGILLGEICMGGLGKISIAPAEPANGPEPLIQVTTDHPMLSCIGAQYAGWPVSHGKFFAMASGPMRSKRGKESILESLSLFESSEHAIGVLECDRIPDKSTCAAIAEECNVVPAQLTLCVAPTRSIAGSIQVVARSVETSLHKLHELGFSLSSIVSAHGSSPLPPPATDFAKAIGRTNDSILYGARVTLWVTAEDSDIEKVVAKVPSGNSKDWGKPFAEIFKAYDFDFYKVDPGLFSPAQITIINLSSGRSWTEGKLRPDVLRQSFNS